MGTEKAATANDSYNPKLIVMHDGITAPDFKRHIPSAEFRLQALCRFRESGCNPSHRCRPPHTELPVCTATG